MKPLEQMTKRLRAARQSQPRATKREAVAQAKRVTRVRSGLGLRMLRHARVTATLLLLLTACGVNADQITLKWDAGPLPCPSFLHVSQHPLTAANLTNAFYRVNIGTNTQVHVSVPKGRWYFGVTTECEPTLLTVDVGATNTTASAVRRVFVLQPVMVGHDGQRRTR